MTAETHRDPAAGMATMAQSPGGLLGLGAMIFLAGYVIFEVILNSASFPTLGTVVAILILMGRYRGTGAAAVLKDNSAMFILGMVLFLEALVYLVFDVRAGRLQVDHIQQLLAQLVHYVAGAVAGLATYRMMR